MKTRDLQPVDIAGICDHTFLQRPECFRGKHADPLAAYHQAFEDFAAGTLALARMPFAVCVRPEEIARMRQRLNASGHTAVKLAATVGFPLGDLTPTAAKVHETHWALEQGAHEIDMVLPYRAFKAGEVRAVAADVRAVQQAAASAGALVKVILEVCELTDDEIVQACRLCADAGVAFVKTSTGFGKSGATVHALSIMRASFAGGIKIAGGANADNFRNLLEAVVGPEPEMLDPLKVRIGESSLLPPQ
jgi:deoxyribose-phosphate aldolase